MFKFIVAASLSSLALCVTALAAEKSVDAMSPNTVVAEVDGVKITAGELEQKQADSLFQAKNAYYSVERNILLQVVDEMLLKKQAEKEGVTVEQLFDRHVKSKLPKDPSDEAMRVYYEGVDTKEPYEAMRGRILESIRNNRLEKAKAAYMASLRAEANVLITLPAPRAEIDLTNTPILGAKNAPVMFVEFADYECPLCQQAAPILQKIEADYKGKVAFAFKETPLPMHAHAEKAAEAAQCAGVQGKYWEYHDALFATQKVDIPDLKQHARDLKLDTASFDKCLDSGQEAAAVQAQLADSQKLSLQGTPTFFINGRMLSGIQSYDVLKKALDQELAVAQRAHDNAVATTASR